jgi:hypothetical protein
MRTARSPFANSQTESERTRCRRDDGPGSEMCIVSSRRCRVSTSSTSRTSSVSRLRSCAICRLSASRASTSNARAFLQAFLTSASTALPITVERNSLTDDFCRPILVCHWYFRLLITQNTDEDVFNSENPIEIFRNVCVTGVGPRIFDANKTETDYAAILIQELSCFRVFAILIMFFSFLN